MSQVSGLARASPFFFFFFEKMSLSTALTVILNRIDDRRTNFLIRKMIRGTMYASLDGHTNVNRLKTSSKISNNKSTVVESLFPNSKVLSKLKLDKSKRIGEKLFKSIEIPDFD